MNSRGLDRASLAQLSDALTAVARSVRQHRLFLQLGNLAGLEIRPHLYLIFARIAETQPVRITQLADAMEIDRSTVSRQVSELVEAGYVTRLADPEDGRSAFVALTSAGEEAQAGIVSAWRDVLARATADWSVSEIDSTARLLGHLARSVEQLVSSRVPSPVRAEPG
ncbi:MAG: MarR family winged helix-turn-helix transcriptional regulator [Mycobacterium sp.]